MAKDISYEDLKRGFIEQAEKDKKFFSGIQKELAKLKIVLSFLKGGSDDFDD